MVLVGGPSYRVGSHRMFVKIARELAERGYPVMRFDFAGMGDSSGEFPGFERLDDDVRAAVDELGARCPDVRHYVLLGLCDGATAAAYYAHTDPRISGLVLLNPWVHTPSGGGKTYLWHYYPRRLLQWDFWRKLLRGKVAVRASAQDLLAKGRDAVKGSTGADFVTRMRDAWLAFPGRSLVVISERDYTASEFNDLWSSDASWKPIRESADVVSISGADHTLSSREHLTRFCAAVCEWQAGTVGAGARERGNGAH